MEAAAAKEEKSILGSIRAPRLEDAGLEDSALSPNSIKQAFFKAANSLREQTTNASAGNPGSCGNQKGEVGLLGVKAGGNEDGENGFDKLKEGDGKKACVDGLQGLKINEDDDKEGKEEAILVEAFI